MRPHAWTAPPHVSPPHYASPPPTKRVGLPPRVSLPHHACQPLHYTPCRPTGLHHPSCATVHPSLAPFVHPGVILYFSAFTHMFQASSVCTHTFRLTPPGHLQSSHAPCPFPTPSRHGTAPSHLRVQSPGIPAPFCMSQPHRHAVPPSHMFWLQLHVLRLTSPHPHPWVPAPDPCMVHAAHSTCCPPC